MPWKRMLAYITGSVDEDLLRRIEYLLEENRVLRNQIEKRLLLTDPERYRLAEKAVALGKLMADTVTIVKPDTILRWHRRLVAKKFDGTGSRQKHGRPPLAAEVQRLVCTMATENASWGYDRIAGAIRNLGHRISDQAVGNVMRRNGLAPSPERRRDTTWASFIRQHKDLLWATDFFTAEIWTPLGLTTFYVLFFIHVRTRKIIQGGITQSPHEQWMKQVARNVTGWGDPMAGGRFLIHDRDAKYPASFDSIFQSIGIEPLKLPARSPNLNAYAERFVRSIKSECLDRLIIFGEAALRRAVSQYIDHYHTERNHQGIENVIPFPDERLRNAGRIVRAERLGGLLSYYHREAA